MDFFEIARLADDAFRNKNLDELNSLTDILIQSKIAGHVGSGYYLRGAYYELFETDEDHLSRALLNYSFAAEANPSAESYTAMATILVKMGAEHYDSALVCLDNAVELKNTPDVDLGFATIYMKTTPPDYKKAKSYFLRAAKFGRAQGLFGYADAARKLGQNYRAIVADAYRIISSPIIYLFIGKKILKGFWV